MQQQQFKAVALPVNEIEANGAIQVRVMIDPKVGSEYTEAIQSGAIFPPLVVFAEKGSQRYLLADGFHRLYAFKKNGIEEVTCHLYEGGVRDALKYALSANDTHGLRRTARDKRNAVALALKDPEWRKEPNVGISRMCRVSEALVRKVREDLVLAGEIEERDTIAVKRGSKAFEQKANQGKSKGKGMVAKTTIAISPEKSKTPDRGPKSQDQVNREEFFGALTAIHSIPHDGAEAVRRWECEDQLERLIYARDFLNEAIEACKKRAA